MTEHGTILTDLIMSRNDFKECSPAIQRGIMLFAEATSLYNHGYMDEGRKKEQEAFEVLRESGREQANTSNVSNRPISQINEPYIPRDLLELSILKKKLN